MAELSDKYIDDETGKVQLDMEIEGRSGELDFDTLRTGGIIKQRQKDLFTVRLMCPGGRVTLDKLEKTLEVARNYGKDYVHISVRQSVEIPYVDFHDLKKVWEKLAEADQKIASCGPRVRVPTACAGCEYNLNGLTDTQKMAGEVNERFFAKKSLPHKFKICFSGCPIDCTRSNEHDLGFQGAVKPAWFEEECIGCGICAEACREGAIENDPDGRPVFYPEKCLYCGDCIRNCPTDSWRAEKTGWTVRCGGKHGRHPVNGAKIAEFVPDEMVHRIIDSTIQWYAREGVQKGRVRLADILLEPEKWASLLSELKPLLGETAVERPPPARNEIHF